MAPTLTRLEILVLLALARLGEAGYGVSVQAAIAEGTGHDVSMAAVYVAMERLEAQGLTETTQSAPRPERGGRSRRHHALTAAGRTALRRERDAMEHMWRGVSLNLEGRRK
jgi:PadR family transcriptional regulator, regulatory protein PadR